ncbi:MAG: hypothetical protein ACE5GH_04095 [Fidelibacterota bacterium]
MRPSRVACLMILVLWDVACETPFTPKPTTKSDLFTASHDFKGGPRIVHKTPVTITWSEITITDFQRYTIHRSVLKDGVERWEQRAESTNPLETSFTDTLDDDLTFRYKVRVEDASGNYKDAETEQTVLQTTSLVTPDEYESLQEAYDSPFIDDGDTVYANPGVYSGPFRFLEKEVIIKGVRGARKTIIHMPRGSRKDVLVSMDRGHLSGFTIREGHGVNLAGTAIMSDCIVTKNRMTDPQESAVVASGNAEVRNCIIWRNNKGDVRGSGGNGAGMILRDFATVRNSRISGNRASKVGGGMVIEGEPSLINSIIDGNYAGGGGGGLSISMFANPKVVNSIIYGNRSGLRGGKHGAVFMGRGSLNMVNSIVWRNSSSGSQDILWRLASYSNIQGYHGGTGNISANPRFVDPLLWNYHLSEDSPCIDSGDPGDEYRDVDGSRNDMGAYGGPYGDW